jgi:hypothetical protein
MMTPAQYARHAALFDAAMTFGDSMLGLQLFGEVAAEALRRWSKERGVDDLLVEYTIGEPGDESPAIRVAEMITVHPDIPARELVAATEAA